VEGVGVVHFGNEDVVRHKIVQRIVQAYAQHAERSAPDIRAAKNRRA
jgi:phosphate starvation-inducible PhoH-like protein